MQPDFKEIIDILLKENIIKAQDDIAFVLGISKQAISDIKAGRSKVTVKQMQTLSKSYNLNPAWLLMGETPILLPQEKKVQITNGDKNIVANGDMVFHAPNNPTSEDIYIEKINGLQAVIQEKQRYIEKLEKDIEWHKSRQ